MLGTLLSENDIVSSNYQYTFTYYLGFWVWDDPDTIQSQLADFFRGAEIGSVLLVTRPLFSTHYVITLQPLIDLPLYNFLDTFDIAFKSMGYDAPEFLSAERGNASSQPGGLQQITQSIAGNISETIGGTIGATIKPVIPYALLGVGLYLAVKIAPKYINKLT